jgi:hypothetical protein
MVTDEAQSSYRKPWGTRCYFCVHRSLFPCVRNIGNVALRSWPSDLTTWGLGFCFSGEQISASTRTNRPLRQGNLTIRDFLLLEPFRGTDREIILGYLQLE